jgi:peptide/nickel transport system permease protein
MLNFLARRIGLGILTIWAVSIISFVIIQLPPGDFVTSYIAKLEAQGGTSLSAEATLLRTQYGLDDPMIVQYAKWLWQVLQGNFGMSLDYQQPVANIIGDRLALTVVVTLAALIFTWIIALPIGIFSAVRQYSIADYIFTFVGFLGLAVPTFLLALILMYTFVVVFHASVGGLFSNDFIDAPWSWAKVWDLVKHLPIPAIVLGLAGTAQLIRIMRANLLDELRKPYVITARAKGLPERRVIFKYPVRVALNPFASTIGFLFPQVVSGSIIVSVVLSLPTVGPVLLTALIGQDMFLAGTIVLMIGTFTVIGMLVSDLILVWLDPRIRLFGGDER